MFLSFCISAETDPPPLERGRRRIKTWNGEKIFKRNRPRNNTNHSKEFKLPKLKTLPQENRLKVLEKESTKKSVGQEKLHTKPPRVLKEVYYAMYKNGKWHRIKPEEMADDNLRAFSLPPDGAHRYEDVDLQLGRKRRKHHSADPDLHKGQGLRQGRRRPKWEQSLERMAKEEKMRPAMLDVAQKKAKRKKRLTFKR